MQIAIDQIKASEFAARPKPLEVGSLAESIKRLGQLQPIKVRPVDGHYECVFGNRRLAAMRVASFTHVEAIVQELDGEQARLQIWEENEEREDLDDVAKGRFLKAYKEDYGLSFSEMASVFQLSRNHIDRLVALTREPEAIRHAVATGAVSGMAAYEVRGILSEVDDRIEVIQEAAAKGLSRRETIAKARAVKYQRRTRRFRTADEDWQQLPSVKELVQQMKDLRDWLRIGRAMVQEEKLAPEAKRFLANKLSYLIRNLQEWKEELGGE